MTWGDTDDNSGDDKQALLYQYHHQEHNGVCVGISDQAPSNHGSIDVGRETPPNSRGGSNGTTTLIRFWIVIVFSILCWIHGMQWETWGPISESMYKAFPGWEPSTVAMMSNWGTITFVLFMFPMCWVTLRCGLRFSIILVAALLSTGAVLRCITETAPFFTISCHLCAILAGVASTILLAAPMLIASDWFPLHERTTAVAVMMGASQLGGVGSYMEPLLVRLPSSQVSISEVRADVMHLMYIDAGMAVALLLAVLVYYPSKPPNPPSITSTTERLDFRPAMASLVKNKRFMILMFSYGISIGSPVAWITFINYSLLPLGLHQDEAMWVGVSAVIVSSLSPVVAGRINDRIQGHIKTILIILMLSTSACFYWFLLLSYGVLPLTKWQVYLSVIGGSALNFATIPLFFEVAVDLAFPVPEILVSGVITACDNIVSIIFLLMYLIPNIGYLWVTYTLVLSTSVTLVPLLFMRFEYTRSHMDTCQN